MNSDMIRIVEVGPRDGLQNEKRIWSVEERVTFINHLSQCGFSEIEVGSFVSPKWIPQMADTDLVFEKINKDENTRYSILVPNEKGMEQALKNNVRDISIFTAASETFTKKNINCTIDESFERFSPIVKSAQEHGIRVRGYVSCVVACPYVGEIAPDATALVAERLFKMGCAEISLGDTIGKGTPQTIEAMIQATIKRVPVDKLAIHCHDTYGTALANIETALKAGIKTIDSAITGLGGCPYGGEKSKGNVATEKVMELLNRLGYSHPLNAEAVKAVVDFVRQVSR
jgi:hydroxymethylglutaryl-CoA lyase